MWNFYFNIRHSQMSDEERKPPLLQQEMLHNKLQHSLLTAFVLLQAG